MKKNKSIFRNIILVIITIATLCGIINTNASNVPKTVVLANKSSMYYLTGNEGYIFGYSTYIKKLSNGTLAYCSGTAQQKVPDGQTLKLKGEADAGLTYILRNGYPNKSFTGDYKKDYYITQAAIWQYFDRTKGTNNWKGYTFKNSPTGSIMYYADKLATGGVNSLKNVNNAKPTINVSSESNELIRENDYYVSSLIKVDLKNADGTYVVDLSKAPKGSLVTNESGTVKNSFNKNEKIILHVPANSSVDNVKISVFANKTTYKSYDYSSNDTTKYQNILVTTLHKEVVTVSDEISFKIVKNDVLISKVDATTGKELPGATLIIRDSNNKEVAKWVSTNEVHKVKLNPGKYTLEEIIAPNGYILSNEKITFTVKEDGTCDKVVMKNQPIKEVEISKVDATNGKELPGATLIIRDSNNKEVAKWVSTNEVHKVKLNPGKYTLEEIIAPNGYILSNEKITFTVKEDGTCDKVVMKNQPIKEVEISKVDATTGKELPGATLIIRDSNNEEVAKWVSTNEVHKVKLNPGKYTLEEIIAPECYILSSEKIEFTVKVDGTCDKVIMKNEPIKDVLISKVDATNGKELPGATLIIRDSNNKEVAKWVSTNEVHKVTLESGVYTLEEIIAPNGYELSKEKISFTVNEDGSCDKVVTMKNYPSVPVPSTSLNASIIPYIIGGVLMIFGGIVMFKYYKKDM